MGGRGTQTERSPHFSLRKKLAIKISYSTAILNYYFLKEDPVPYNKSIKQLNRTGIENTGQLHVVISK
jgi:hypothetical protein